MAQAFYGLNTSTGFIIGDGSPIDVRYSLANATCRYDLGLFSYEGLIVFQEDTKERYLLVDRDNIGTAAGWVKLPYGSNKEAVVYDASKTYYKNDLVLSTDGLVWECQVYRVTPADIFPQVKQNIHVNDFDTTSVFRNGSRVEVWKQVRTL